MQQRRLRVERPNEELSSAESPGSVTQWVIQLVEGDEDAATRLWNRYHRQLVKLARAKLRGAPRRVADEEDAAIAAFDSFYRRAKDGRFPRLADREDLWQLLVAITLRKIIDQVNRELRQKRGGGRVVGETDLRLKRSGSDLAEWSDAIAGDEPSPALAAQFSDEYERLMQLLPDDQARQVAKLKIEGHTEVEIAARLQRVTRTVRRRIEVIRRIWAEELERGQD